MELTKITQKPWGREVLLHQGFGYAVKEITLNSLSRTSLHFHEIKHEYIYLVSGSLRVDLPTDSDSDCFVILNPGSGLAIPPSQIHRMSAIETAVYVEAQTDHLSDVIRLQDDHSRVEV